MSVKGLIILAVILGLLFLAGLLYLGLRAGGIQRQTFRNMEAQRDIANEAIDEIEEKADQYQDIDSVLATEVRAIIRASRQKYKKLRKGSPE